MDTTPNPPSNPSTPPSDPVPSLVRYLFSEGAPAAWNSAPEDGPLRRWARWFDDWLASRRAQVTLKTYRRSKTAWRHFLTRTRLLPWQVERAQVAAWVEAMLESGLKPVTIKGYLADLRGFYRFVPLEIENPALGVLVPGYEHYKNSLWLCKEEVEAFLGAIDRENILGARDFAFFLTLLLTGQHVREVRNLCWGDLAVPETASMERSPASPPQVFWRRGNDLRSEALPLECWEAIHDYLVASGRLYGIEPSNYIFAPLKERFGAPIGHADDWIAARPISVDYGNGLIRRYLEWAELGVPQLTFNDLRHTAVMLRVNAGIEPSGIQAWLGFYGLKETKRYLRKLEEGTVDEERLKAAGRVWSKGPYPRKKGTTGQLINLKHGYYSKHLGSEDGAGEGGKGLNLESFNLDALIERMNMILEHTFKLIMTEQDPRESVKLLDIYGRASDRILRCIDKARKLEEDEAVVTLNQVLEEIAEEFEKGTLREYFDGV